MRSRAAPISRSPRGDLMALGGVKNRRALPALLFGFCQDKCCSVLTGYANEAPAVPFCGE